MGLVAGGVAAPPRGMGQMVPFLAIWAVLAVQPQQAYGAHAQMHRQIDSGRHCCMVAREMGGIRTQAAAPLSFEIIMNAPVNGGNGQRRNRDDLALEFSANTKMMQLPPSDISVDQEVSPRTDDVAGVDYDHLSAAD